MRRDLELRGVAFCRCLYTRTPGSLVLGSGFPGVFCGRLWARLPASELGRCARRSGSRVQTRTYPSAMSRSELFRYLLPVGSTPICPPVLRMFDPIWNYAPNRSKNWETPGFWPGLRLSLCHRNHPTRSSCILPATNLTNRNHKLILPREINHITWLGGDSALEPILEVA